MDAGLAKCAPNSDDLSAEHYRNWRRQLELFERMCKKRGPLVISEGALMVLQNLRGQAWDACEMCDMDRLDTRHAFDELRRALDHLYRYSPEVELPGRCEDFFSEFARLPKETLNAYCLRHGKEVLRLKESGMIIPDMLAGWHLMSRSGIPKW